MSLFKDEVMAVIASEDATGCAGAGDYLQYAHQYGYKHVETLDWTSSAGDCTFLVSKDGNEWHMLTQTNNYPRYGFTWEIDEKPNFGFPFVGSAEEALNEAWVVFYEM